MVSGGFPGRLEGGSYDSPKEADCSTPPGPPGEGMLTERWASAEVLKRIAHKEYLDKFWWKQRFTNY